MSVRTAQTGSNGWGVREDETGALDSAAPPAVTARSAEGADAPEDPKPDAPRYAAMGDAVTCNVAEFIGLRLRVALEKEHAENG